MWEIAYAVHAKYSCFWHAKVQGEMVRLPPFLLRIGMQITFTTNCIGVKLCCSRYHLHGSFLQVSLLLHHFGQQCAPNLPNKEVMVMEYIIDSITIQYNISLLPVNFMLGMLIPFFVMTFVVVCGCCVVTGFVGTGLALVGGLVVGLVVGFGVVVGGNVVVGLVVGFVVGAKQMIWLV